MTQPAATAADAQYGSLVKLMDAAGTPEAKQRLLVKMQMYRADVQNAQRAFETLTKGMKPADAQSAMQGALQQWIDQGDSTLRKAVAEGVFGAIANVGKPPAGEHKTPVAGKITGKDDGGVPRIGGRRATVKGNVSRADATDGKGTVDPKEHAVHEKGAEEDTILAPDSEDFDYEGVEDGEQPTVGHPGKDEGEDEDTRKKKARAKLAAGGGKIKIGQAFSGKVGQKEPTPKGGRAEKSTLAGELLKIAPDAMIDVLTKMSQPQKVAMVNAAETYAADLMAFADGIRGKALTKGDVRGSVNAWMKTGDALTKKWVAEALAGAAQIPHALGTMIVGWEGQPVRGRGPFG